VFENGRGSRYSVEENAGHQQGIFFPKVPDGTYEFVYGKGYQVNYLYLPIFGRIVSSITPLSEDHPLMAKTPENIQRLYNLGIEMNNSYEPQGTYQLNYPSRYAYFRNGDLYTMGAPLLKKGSETLQKFAEREEKKEKQSSAEKPYIAFKDYGPPLKNGQIDTDFIKTFGVHVPDKMYFALGDNHAMSADSRVFGFIPEDNLQGAPSLILWPADRMGMPWQKPYPILNAPRLIVWGFILIIGAVWYILDQRSLRRNYQL
jgi:signal peptidase I